MIRQLNHWGVQRWLGIRDAAELFASAAAMLHSTSLIRYPTFVNGEAYDGAPNMLRQPLLKRYLHEYFVSEIAQLPDALLFPLGQKVKRVLQGHCGRTNRGGLNPRFTAEHVSRRLPGQLAQWAAPAPHESRAIRYGPKRVQSALYKTIALSNAVKPALAAIGRTLHKSWL